MAPAEQARRFAHEFLREMKLPCGYNPTERDEGDGWIRMPTPHARDCDRLTEKVEPLIALAREVFEKMRACVYMAEDSSEYHGGGGAREVEKTIAELAKRVGVEE